LESDYVRRLGRDLVAHGKDVWIDTDGLADGEVFPEALRTAIEGADTFVFVITPEAVASRYCQTEVDHAAKLGKRIIPLLLRPVPDDALPSNLRDRNWIPADAADAVPRLIKAIETDLDHVRAHTRWTLRAGEWKQAGYDHSLLPRGSELANGEAWLARCATDADPAPTALQRELLLRGRASHSARQRRLVAVMAAALVASLALLVFALVARHSAEAQRTAAQAQALAARSDAAVALSPQAALYLARRAVLVHSDGETLRALKQAEDAQSLAAVLPSVRYVYGCNDVKPAYRPGFQELALGSCDGTTRIDNPRTGEPIRILRDRGQGGTIAYRPDGAELAILDRATLLLTDPVTGRVRAKVRVPGGRPAEPFASSTALVYSPNGHQIAVITPGRSLVLVDDRSRRVRTLDQRRDGFDGVAFTHDGRSVVASTGEGPVEIFDSRSGRETLRLHQPAHVGAGPVAISPDGREMAVGVSRTNSNGFVQVWSTGSWRRVGIRARLTGDFAYSLAYTPDGSQLVIGTSYGRVDVVPRAGGSPTFSALMRATVFGVAVTAGGNVTAIDGKGDVRIWRIDGPAREVIAPVAPPTSVSQAGDTVEVVAPLRDKQGSQINFYSADGLRDQAPLTVAKAGRRVDALSENGRLLLDATGEGPGRATVWNTQRRRPVARLPRLSIVGAQWYGPRLLLALNGSSDSSNFYYTRLRTYDPRTRRLGPPMNAVVQAQCQGFGAALSDDGTRAVISDDCGHVAVYNALTRRLIDKVKPPDDVDSVAISSNGALIADSYLDGEGDIRDARTLRVRERLFGHVGAATLVAFDHNDRWLVSVGADHTMRVWQTSDGQLLRTLTTPAPLAYGNMISDDRVAVYGDTSSPIDVFGVCLACDDRSRLLRAAKRWMGLPLDGIDRSFIQRAQ
jgi:WD40 repeat protein